MKVIVAGGGTGGHLMPALAIAAALRAARDDVEPVLVGARRGVEATILPTRDFPFHLLPAEPIYRRAWWRNLRWLVLLPRLLAACRAVLDRERPVLVVGTGGYAAGPILHAALRRGLPIALQEQNAYPGITTRRLAARARQIHLGFPEARDRLRPGPHTDVCVSGNPIQPPDPARRARVRADLNIPAGTSALFVVGGSQGARALNHALAAALDAGSLERLVVLWSTGAGSYTRFAPFALRGSVHVRAFWDPIADAYAAADLVVARAGAMTTAELLAWGLPSVLVPLPSAAADHQTANAAALESAGAAIHLPESRLTAATLADVVRGLLSAPERLAAMAAAARQRARPDAARAIAARLIGLVS